MKWLGRRTPCKRTLFVLVLFILGGAIINVAVAWGSIAFPCRATLGAPMTYARQGRHVFCVWEAWQSVFVIRLNGSLLTGSSESTDATTMQEIEVHRILPSGALGGLFESVTRNMKVPYGATAVSIDDGWTIDQRGWPLRTFWGGVQWNSPMKTVGEVGHRSWIAGTFSDKPFYNYWSILLDRRSAFGAGSSSPTEFRILPYRPMLRGCVVNTSFYSMLLWLLLAAPRELRGWRRTKRGLCPRCAYPIGTSLVCTECGAPAPKERRNVATGETRGSNS